MKRAIVLAVMIAIGMAGLKAAASRDKKDEATVYICVSKTAKRYHCDRDCRGLNNCTHEIKIVTVKEAEKRGLTRCKLCY